MAKIEDKTTEVVTYLKGKLNSYRVDRGLTTFSDHTTDVWPVGKSGYEDKA